MNLDWSEDDRFFRERVADWLADNVPKQARPEGMAAVEFDRAWQRTLHQGGWAGISWPQEFGGQGLSLTQQMIWYEESAKAGAPSAGVFFVAQMHAGPTLILLGTQDQKNRHLNGILAGDEIWCQGFSEPGSGSDLASLRTRGVVDGDAIVVTGQKIWTSYADAADYQELLIRTEPGSERHRGLTWIICDMRLPGITIHPIRKMTGHSEFASVFYDEVRIPLSNVVGEVGQGWATAMATLGFERGTAFTADMVHLVLRIEELIDYARSHPLAGSKGMAWADDECRRRLASLRADAAALRAMNYSNLSRYVSGEVPGAEGSIVKLFTNQLAHQVERAAIDMMGTRLFDADAPERRWLEAYYRNLVQAIGGGTSDIQREIVADRVLGLPRSR